MTMDSPSPTANSQNNGTRFRPITIVWISFLFFASAISEITSSVIIPDVIHRFTQNAFFISVILALNPFFGFTAQPWAGYYSDQIWTPIGRRKPLIIASAFLLAFASLGLPFSEGLAERMGFLEGFVNWIGHPEISSGLIILAIFLTIYQFMGDVISIMTRAVIGDLIPLHHRGKAFAAGHIISSIMQVITLYWGSEIAANSEMAWFSVVAAVSIMAIIPMTFLVKEPYSPPPKKEDKQLGDYLRIVIQTPHFLTLCLVVAGTFVSSMFIRDYYRLFTLEQLGLSLTEALRPFVLMPIVAILASYPIGWLSDRIGHKYITMIGASLVATAGVWGLFANSIMDLAIIAMLVGVGSMTTDLALNAYLLSFMTKGKIGQMSGFANIFRAVPRFTMLLGAGAFIELFDRNYRLAFAGAAICSVASIITIFFLPSASRAEREIKEKEIV